MKLSKRCENALKVLIELGYRQGHPVSLREIGLRVKTPIKFLEQIMMALRRAGWVECQRGRGGGYVLAHPAADIRLSDVIRRLDGLKNTYLPDDHMGAEAYLGLYQSLSEVHQRLENSLEQTTVEDLCRRSADLVERFSKSYMYYI